MGQQVARIQPLALVPYLGLPAQEWDFQPVPGITIVRGQVLGAVSAGANDVDTVSMAGTGGDWALTVQNNNGTYTAYNLAYNISLANLQAALTALPNIGYTEVAGVQTANVNVTGTPGTSYVLTGANALADFALGIVTVDATNGGNNGLTGGGVTVAHTTQNNIAGQVKAYASGNSDGSQNPIAISKFAFSVDQNGNVTIGGAESNLYGNYTGPQFGLAMGHTMTIPAFISGPFLSTDLVGMDGTALTAFKARTFQAPNGASVYRIP